MGRKIHFCKVTGGNQCRVTEYSNTAYELASPNGLIAISALVACTAATGNITSLNGINGQLDYEACCGGTNGNSLSIIHQTGNTGDISRPLETTQTGTTLFVTAGTDSNGDIVDPTAQEVYNSIIAAGESITIVPSLPGDGTATIGYSSVTLSGGLNDGSQIFDETMMASKKAVKGAPVLWVARTEETT